MFQRHDGVIDLLTPIINEVKQQISEVRTRIEAIQVGLNINSQPFNNKVVRNTDNANNVEDGKIQD